MNEGVTWQDIKEAIPDILAICYFAWLFMKPTFAFLVKLLRFGSSAQSS